ncbi:hypothetical protein Tco_1321976, partial [Tanacetum coccineum]
KSIRRIYSPGYAILSPVRKILSTSQKSNTSYHGVNGKVKGVGRGSPMKLKLTRNSGSPRSSWIMRDERDMLLSTKPGDIVFNPQPVFEFNTTTGQVMKSTDNVKDTDKASVVAVVASKLSDLVKGKADVVKDKVDVGKKLAEVVKDTVLVKDKVHYEVVKDNAQVDVVLDNVQEKSAGNVDKDTTMVKDKVHFDFIKDKAQVDVVSAVKGNLAVDVVSNKVQDDEVKDKAQDVVKKKLTDVKEKSTGNVVKVKLLTVVKGKIPKVDVKEKSTDVKEKSTGVQINLRLIDMYKGLKTKQKRSDGLESSLEFPLERSRV